MTGGVGVDVDDPVPQADMIRYLVNEYTQPIPAVLEIPSKAGGVAGSRGSVGRSVGRSVSQSVSQSGLLVSVQSVPRARSRPFNTHNTTRFVGWRVVRVIILTRLEVV